MIALLTRAGFLGRVAVVATGSLLSFGASSPKPLCAEMTTPDYAAWDALVKAHVKPSEIRGIGLNAVDYEGESSKQNSTGRWTSLELLSAAAAVGVFVRMYLLCALISLQLLCPRKICSLMAGNQSWATLANMPRKVGPRAFMGVFFVHAIPRMSVLWKLTWYVRRMSSCR